MKIFIEFVILETTSAVSTIYLNGIVNIRVEEKKIFIYNEDVFI
jgi:hypothetical protein